MCVSNAVSSPFCNLGCEHLVWGGVPRDVQIWQLLAIFLVNLLIHPPNFKVKPMCPSCTLLHEGADPPDLGCDVLFSHCVATYSQYIVAIIQHIFPVFGAIYRLAWEFTRIAVIRAAWVFTEVAAGFQPLPLSCVDGGRRRAAPARPSNSCLHGSRINVTGLCWWPAPFRKQT